MVRARGREQSCLDKTPTYILFAETMDHSPFLSSKWFVHAYSLKLAIIYPFVLNMAVHNAIVHEQDRQSQC